MPEQIYSSIKRIRVEYLEILNQLLAEDEPITRYSLAKRIGKREQYIKRYLNELTKLKLVDKEKKDGKTVYSLSKYKLSCTNGLYIMILDETFKVGLCEYRGDCEAINGTHEKGSTECKLLKELIENAEDKGT